MAGVGLFAYLSFIGLLPSASQIIVYTYDNNGRVTSVTYTGSGAPNGCTGSAPTWGTGTLGCFRWSP